MFLLLSLLFVFLVGSDGTKIHHPLQLCPRSCLQHDISEDTIKIIPCEATSDRLLDCVVPTLHLLYVVGFVWNDGTETHSQ